MSELRSLRVRTRVLPDPAPAIISSGPSVVSTAWRCCGFKSSKSRLIYYKYEPLTNCARGLRNKRNPPQGVGHPAFRSILSISRGDINNDNVVGSAIDLTLMVDYIFRGGPPPFPSPLIGDCK